ncbi:MAG: sigma-70 family RNA polymerase sigma factor, partial [Rhodospirillales bacterium]|nr:sigma-70 family RNA polymerase sigma factor [Rhodospirillales bacterium]
MNNPLEDTVLNAYFKDLAQSNPLSREREAELATRVKAGDLEARDELVQANLPFAVNVARTYQNRGLSLAELISSGNVGLLIAADRFDGSKGYKFITYAVWWIRQSILLALTEQARTVRLPS